MAADKQVVLITGATAGIGFDLAAQLMEVASIHVLLGARSSEKGQAAVKDLQSRKLPGSVELLLVDVSNDDSIAAAAKNVESKFGRLDVLINNAGIAQGSGKQSEVMAQIYRTNVIGVQVMTETFVPLLRKSSTTPRIINVSSGMGSLKFRAEPSYSGYSLQVIEYRASKSALNMIVLCHLYEYQEENIKIFLYCPGFTVSSISDMNTEANGAHATSVATKPLVSIVQGEKDDLHGKFINHKYEEYPW